MVRGVTPPTLKPVFKPVESHLYRTPSYKGPSNDVWFKATMKAPTPH